MPVLYNKVKSLTIRVSKFLEFSNFLICIYCFYYIFITLFFNFYILEYIFLIILDNSKFVLAGFNFKVLNFKALKLKEEEI